MSKQDVIGFLELNGFKRDSQDIYTKGKCIVEIGEDNYSVESDNSIVVSNDLQIYWLIGYLTYYGYLDKDYKQL